MTEGPACPTPPADAHIRLDLHPTHTPAVAATASGPTSDAARSPLHDLGCRTTGTSMVILARIDREEPYYANASAGQTFVRSLMEGLTNAPWSSAEAPYGPVDEAGWTEDHTFRRTWRAPDRSLAFEHNPHGVEERWTAYGGADPNHPDWAIRFSATTAPEVLARLTTKLINTTALGCDRLRGRAPAAPLSPLPPPAGCPQPGARHR
ncbi:MULTISPECIES: DUF317 domain-containing protein [Streptomyces]|uniref:DUF317 domain-containing protein n=1 Tax=Streptomyces venezuelae TaxID=54571 RepID=A0A5P2AM77_STRVZ|nr:DUF317 domain-containing protein [Streptomyces venezuelae]QES18720.1 hypothetical protein DEJ46_06160 [Streptomyces venezuelae]